MAKLFTALENSIKNSSENETEMLKAKLGIYTNNRDFNDDSELSKLYRIENAINTGFIQLEAMEKLYTTIESFKDTGLNQQTVQILQISVESISISLGDKDFITLPSQESFESANNRITATEIALETIGEKIKEFIITLWHTIKKYVHYAILIIRNIYKSLTDSYLIRIDDLEEKLESLDPYHKGKLYYNNVIAKGFGLPTSDKVDMDAVIGLISDYNKNIYILSDLNNWYKQLSKNTKDYRNHNSFTSDDVFRYIYTVNESIHKIIDREFKLFNGETFIEGESYIINDEKLESLDIKSLWIGKEDKAKNIPISPETNGDILELLKNMRRLRLAMVDKKMIDDVDIYLFKAISENENNLNKIKNNDKYSDEYRNVIIIMIKSLYMLSFFAKTIIKGYTDSVNMALKYAEISADRNEEPYNNAL